MTTSLVAVGALVVAACGGTSSTSPSRSPLQVPSAVASSTPAPDIGTPSATLDPCLVGTWDAASTSLQLSYEGGVTLTGGAGEVLTIERSGSFTDDYARMAPPQVDTPSGHQYRVELVGDATGHLASTPGAVTVTIDQTQRIAVNVYQDGILILTTHPPATAAETYRCTGSALTVTSADGGTISQYRRR